MSLAELPAALVRTGMRILIALTAMAIRSSGIKRWKQDRAGRSRALFQ